MKASIFLHRDDVLKKLPQEVDTFIVDVVYSDGVPATRLVKNFDLGQNLYPLVRFVTGMTRSDFYGAIKTASKLFKTETVFLSIPDFSTTFSSALSGDLRDLSLHYIFCGTSLNQFGIMDGISKANMFLHADERILGVGTEDLYSCVLLTEEVSDEALAHIASCDRMSFWTMKSYDIFKARSVHIGIEPGAVVSKKVAISDRLTVWSSPSRKSDIIGKIYLGNEVTVVGEESGYFKLRDGGYVLTHIDAKPCFQDL